MEMLQWLIVAVTFVELILLSCVIALFFRIKRSENMLEKLQSEQANLLEKIRFNTELENELVSSFEQRQKELARLDNILQARSAELKKLIQQAEEVGRSPKRIRELILEGWKKGRSVQALAKDCGLSREEVEWILDQEN